VLIPVFENLCEDTVSSRSANSRQRSAIWQDTWLLSKKQDEKVRTRNLTDDTVKWM